MSGKRYYVTTIGAWRRHALRFANSHFIVLDAASLVTASDAASEAGNSPEYCGPQDETHIIALIEADEGTHVALEDDAGFDVLPHPLAQKPISDPAQAVLASHGVLPGATMFEVAEAVARFHPLLRHRVF